MEAYSGLLMQREKGEVEQSSQLLEKEMVNTLLNVTSLTK